MTLPATVANTGPIQRWVMTTGHKGTVHKSDKCQKQKRSISKKPVKEELTGGFTQGNR